MAMTNSQKQAALRERRVKAGLVLFQAWVTPAQATQLKTVIGNQRVAGDVALPIATTPVAGVSEKPQRRGRKVDPVAQKNRALIIEHKEAIEARLRAGEKPTALATWLRQFGFDGTGGTFNGFWREV